MEKLRKNTCRKAISFFVTGLLTIACLPANVSVFSAAWNGTVDTSWYQAGETQLSISNPEELAGLAKLVNDGTTNFEGVTHYAGSRFTDESADQLGKMGNRRSTAV